MLNVELFSTNACDCELVNCELIVFEHELKPSAMLSVELSVKPMLNCSIRNFGILLIHAICRYHATFV